jgi:electron transport complex protein RnfB
MQSDRKIFRKLQRHLDKQPVGFPRALFGADIRLLKHHFNEEEAELALELDYRYESLETILARVKIRDISVDVLRAMLYGMSERGSIGYRKMDGIEYFCLVPLVVGMYEGMVFSLTDRYLKDVKRYQHSLNYGTSLLGTAIPQMRTIPVEKSIKIEHGLPA